MTESPSALLRRAADPLNVMKVSHEDWPPTLADREWVAAMSPGVAPDLSAWLRAEADSYDRREALMLVGGGSGTAQAVAFARVVLGEDPS